jgi:hypothetical protein
MTDDDPQKKYKQVVCSKKKINDIKVYLKKEIKDIDGIDRVMRNICILLDFDPNIKRPPVPVKEIKNNEWKLKKLSEKNEKRSEEIEKRIAHLIEPLSASINL